MNRMTKTGWVSSGLAVECAGLSPVSSSLCLNSLVVEQSKACVCYLYGTGIASAAESIPVKRVIDSVRAWRRCFDCT